MKQFFSKIIEFLEHNNPVDDKVMEKIEGLIQFRLKPEASMGALEGKMSHYDAFVKDLKDHNTQLPNELQQDYDNRIVGLMKSTERQKAAGAMLKDLESMIPDIFDKKATAMQRDFRTIQLVASGIDMLEGLKGLKSTQADNLFNALSGPQKPLGYTEKIAVKQDAPFIKSK